MSESDSKLDDTEAADHKNAVIDRHYEIATSPNVSDEEKEKSYRALNNIATHQDNNTYIERLRKLMFKKKTV